MKRNMLLTASAILLIGAMACTISFGAQPQQEQPGAVETAVAQTLAASQPQQPPVVVVPTVTQAAGPTAVLPPTATPQPCNKGQFVSETIPDNTIISPNATFTKTWRFRNIGTCTWNSNYKLVYFSGDQMGGVATKNFTQNVGPNETIDISVDLKAPGTAGTYKGNWKLLDDTGNAFVNVMYVQIVVPGLAPPVAAFPDLRITSFTISPATPTMGVPCTVTITAHNGGNANAGAFMVRWYGLSTFANASCAWAFSGLAAGASDSENCTFTFNSWYPINKTSIVYIDHDNQVTESNEGNNTRTISPFGVAQ